MATELQGVVGPQPAGDGTAVDLRMSRDSSQVVTQSHGRKYEGTSRGRVFTVSTAATGTTIVAANATPVAAAAATILTLYNPLGSGVNLEILKAWLTFISGTPGAGQFVWNYAFAQNISAAQNATPAANFISGLASVAKGYTQTALTGGVGAQILGRPFGASGFAGAIAATTPTINFVDDADGDIVVPPGGLISIAAAATGTTHIVAGGIEFQEVPLTSSSG